MISQAIAGATARKTAWRTLPQRLSEIRDLENSRNTVIRLFGGVIDTDELPVQFTRVKPGETLIREEAAE